MKKATIQETFDKYRPENCVFVISRDNDGNPSGMIIPATGIIPETKTAQLEALEEEQNAKWEEIKILENELKIRRI